MIELHRTVIDDQVIAIQFKLRNRFTQVGLNVQETVAVGGNPHAALERDGENPASVFPGHPARGSFLALPEANFPRGLPAPFG